MTVTVTLQFPNAALAVDALARMVSSAPVDAAQLTQAARAETAAQLEAAGIDPRPVVSMSVDVRAAADAPAPAPAAEAPKPKRGRKSNAEKAAAAAQAPATAPATPPLVAGTPTPNYPTVEQVIAKGREVYEKLGPQKGLVQCNALLARYGATRFSEVLTARSPDFMKDADACIGGKDFTAVVD